MTKFKTIITAAIAALALTTASLAIPGQAFAGGHGHGGHGGHGGQHATESAMVISATAFFGHGHHHHRPFFAYNSCWKWSPYGPVNVCQRYLLISRREMKSKLVRAGRLGRVFRRLTIIAIGFPAGIGLTTRAEAWRPIRS